MSVLNRLLHWAESRCPCENEQPNPCPLCGASVENLEPCKAAENTLPLSLLADLRDAIAAEERTRYTLGMAQRLCAEALPKFNWGASALDANAISLLNTVPHLINVAVDEMK